MTRWRPEWADTGPQTDRQADLFVSQFVFGWSAFCVMSFDNGWSQPRYRGLRPSAKQPGIVSDVPHWTSTTDQHAMRIVRAIAEVYRVNISIADESFTVAAKLPDGREAVGGPSSLAAAAVWAAVDAIQLDPEVWGATDGVAWEVRWEPPTTSPASKGYADRKAALAALATEASDEQG